MPPGSNAPVHLPGPYPLLSGSLAFQPVGQSCANGLPLQAAAGGISVRAPRAAIVRLAQPHQGYFSLRRFIVDVSRSELINVG